MQTQIWGALTTDQGEVASDKKTKQMKQSKYRLRGCNIEFDHSSTKMIASHAQVVSVEADQ